MATLGREKTTEEAGDQTLGTSMVVAIAVGVGLLVIALEVIEQALSSYLFLHLVIAGDYSELSAVDGLVSLLFLAVLFLIIFEMGAHWRVDVAQGGPMLLVLVFVAGLLAPQIALLVHEAIIGVPLLLPSLSPLFVEDAVFSAIANLLLVVAALSIGGFWADNPLWRPKAWLEKEDEDADEVTPKDLGER